MKNLILIMVALLSFNTFAKDTYYCWETNDAGLRTDRLVVLTQEGSERMQEGRSYSFKFDLYQEDSACFPDSEGVATVEVNDVMVGFKVKGKRINGMMYLDEMHESWIKINGKETRLDCYIE